MEKTMPDVNKIWENLTIADNFIFQKVMRKKRLCKRFIEKILHIKIRHKRPLRGHYAHALA